ncbi:Tetratricopeptide repeat-containing protein [Pseudorhodobacter antarcticus]|jgi:Flp pilus assembly protein TadD|uniref:Tetratricopeptide repeat-containing protein n=1 Tax=Pseudorhodobacter antarcticus TaxID=1077947 RepID=A0A1H8CQ31_9RHOB|nr:tetratricopeptide repeat protein [Pseudorhodobacter antarcticus]SEM97361.1 Tetratricopeptide repeat-containing protein [Pseudorhodobacter antarcticus]
MTRRRSVLILGLILGLPFLAACQSTGGLSASDRARNAAPGTDTGALGVDGLLVGHRLMEAGEFDLALRAYLRGASEQGLNADVLSALGSANLRLGRLGQAETLLRQAIKADPTSVPAHNNLGVVLMERGNSGEARAVFQQAFALDSGSSDSIQQNLRLAIARSNSAVYDDQEQSHDFTLVRRDRGQYVLLSQL